MSKELEALERGICEFEKNLEDDCNNEWLKRVVAGMKKCYQRLEFIDNVKPDEALKDLEKISNCYTFQDGTIGFCYDKEINTIKNYILIAQEQEKENARNEEILQKYYQEGITLDSVRALKQERDNYKKVLDIIKETKNIKVSFYENGSGKHYKLEFDRTRNQTITKEKFDLLKEFFRMKYIRTKDGVYELVDTYYMCVDGVETYMYDNKGRGVEINSHQILNQADTIEELCDCFIIKFVESNTFSAYDIYEDARYVYEHDKQNTTCILYGAIDTETALKYVAIETFNGLTYIED